MLRKINIFAILYKVISFWNITFASMLKFDWIHPWGTTGLSKDLKRVPFPGWQNKSCKFRGLAKNKTWRSSRTINFSIWHCPEALRACQYQFGGLDEWAPNLNSLEPLGLWCCVVLCGVCGVVWCHSWRVCVFHNQKMHFYLIY